MENNTSPEAAIEFIEDVMEKGGLIIAAKPKWDGSVDNFVYFNGIALENPQAIIGSASKSFEMILLKAMKSAIDGVLGEQG
jgi:hypothetical protein